MTTRGPAIFRTIVSLVVLVTLGLAAATAGAAKADEGYWTSQQTADYLAVPLSTLRYWTWQRTGARSYRIGRCRKYKPADVRAWAERQVSEPTTG
jgi:hypothetical protein